MSASVLIDWQRSPPALGLALSRGQHRSPSPGNGDALRECIEPALAATTPAGFVREVGRRLPLFAALHAKEVDQVEARERHATDLGSVTRGYAALGAELVSWGDRLGEVAQAELDVAISMLQRSNEALLAAPESRSVETANLFRATKALFGRSPGFSRCSKSRPALDPTAGRALARAVSALGLHRRSPARRHLGCGGAA